MNWNFNKTHQTAPAPQAAPQPSYPPQAAPQPSYPPQAAPTHPGAGRSLADQFLAVKPTEKDVLGSGRYILQIIEPYTSFPSSKDNRTCHKAKFHVVYTPDGTSTGVTSALWKENDHPHYAQGDVKAYMCAVIGSQTPSPEDLNGFLSRAGQFVAVRVNVREHTTKAGRSTQVTDYKWAHIPAEHQQTLASGQATAELLEQLLRG